MKNPATILITIPLKKGDPTEYTASWAEKGVKIAKDLGYNVIAIRGNDVTYNNVTDAIKKYRPMLTTHFGHGCPLSLQGQRECIIARKYGVDELICMAESPYIEERQRVLKMLNPMGKLSCPGICSLDNDPCSPYCTYDTNIDLLKGTIVFAVACHSASQLGKCAINYGISAYIGEDDLLMFPVDTLNSQDLFGEVHITMFKELLLGKSIYEAERTMSELEDSYIRRFKKIKYVALPMLWNKIHRKILGNGNVLIYS
jgi:hypothetical protein